METQQILSDEQISTAVEWWANVIRSPKFDNGASDPANIFASLMASTLANRNPVTDEQVATFKSALAKNLSCATTRYNAELHVDYHPNELLFSAALAAGISDSLFPWKTNMWFRKGGVQVSCGYRAPIEHVLPKTEPEDPDYFE